MSMYVDLPWEQIRREWESGEIGLMPLARKYGISSVTVLKRRRQKEGWTRDEDQGHPHEVALCGSPQAAMRQATAEAALEDHTVIEGTISTRSRRPLPARPMVRLPVPTVETAQTPIERELALAREVQAGGLEVLQQIRTVLRAPRDEAEKAETLAALQRLIRINPDRDSLAALLTSASKAVELGLAMERRTRMTETMGRLATPGQPLPGGSPLIRELLSRLDVATVEKIRAWALEVQQRNRQAEIDGSRGA